LASSAFNWYATLDGDTRPTASPISRTLGGYPYRSTQSRMNSRIRRWRAVRSAVTRSGKWLTAVTERSCGASAARARLGVRRRMAAEELAASGLMFWCCRLVRSSVDTSALLVGQCRGPARGASRSRNATVGMVVCPG
jgi:hypothetical protein